MKQDRTQCDLLPMDYDFQVSFKVYPSREFSPAILLFSCVNAEKLGVSLTLSTYDQLDRPRLYSMEGKRPGGYPVMLEDGLILPNGQSDYRYAAHGPNGYLVEVRGNAESPTEAAFNFNYYVTRDEDGKILSFHFPNWPTASGTLKLVNAYTGAETMIPNGTKRVDVATKDGWYDVSFVDAVNTDSKYLRRYAGHIETGRMSRTDPAIGMIYDETKRVYVPAVV